MSQQNGRHPPPNNGQNSGTNNGDSGPGLVAQPHGGALLRGGKRNNRGGGRPPDNIRALFRSGAARGADLLTRMLNGESVVMKAADGTETKLTPESSDLLRAIDLCAKYGVGPLQGVPDEIVAEKCAKTSAILRATLTDEQLAVIEPQLEAVWNG